jgi:hypothetical protein
MKHSIVFVFVFLFFEATSQQITCKVIDANSGTALPYATIIFKKANQFSVY